MKFIGKDEEIDVRTQNPEFIDWKWINPKELINVAVNFKVDIYKEVEKKTKTLERCGFGLKASHPLLSHLPHPSVLIIHDIKLHLASRH